MTENFDAPSFRRQVRDQALTFLRQAPADQAAAAKAVQALAENFNQRFRNNRAAIACGPGCGDCCQVNVAVLEAETALVLQHLRQKLDSDACQAFARRIRRLQIRVGGLDDEERLLTRVRCPFLDDRQSCTIYPVRPLLCRAMTSTDRQSCRDAIALAALGEERPVLVHLLQKELFEAAFLGLADALAATGRDNRSIPLITALDRKLNQPVGRTSEDCC
ncbi:putative zinc- or iron-chelating protein [Geothermobacter ehrlichii]|uniref:Putative zinc-or iron-chelating protein n=1 Tax=Geothermobacter ehrlichii TaxID=213224 RepID=A0A5D3WKL8_9BACT|nr:YkgJ family cysteine cluster protein [Geothermobacter ehrlichii]TYO98476.1 putative zinc- or iron-chelating protein [Geothermobacter ehrlichii]